MKTIALTLIAAGLGFAQSQPASQSGAPATDTKSTPAKSTAAKATNQPSKASKAKTPVPPKPKAVQQAPVTTIPKGATQVEPNLYRATDSNGKTWMYRQTPFGLSKWEDTGAAAQQPPPAQSEPVAITDLGDSIRFEKKTPFGATKWTRKKSELTDEEKALVSSQGTAAQAEIKTPEQQ